jgi:3-methyl-2-oxobutanoate hydroxymethyltransferase
VKKYGELGEEMKQAISEYARDVREGRFPGFEHSYSSENEDEKNRKGADEDNPHTG